MVNLRGDVLPVLDAGLLLGSPFPTDPQYVLVIDASGSHIGLAVSGLPRIVELDVASGATPDVRTVDGEPVVMADAVALVERQPENG